MPTPAPDAPHRIAALVHPPQSTFELGIAAEVFGGQRAGAEPRYAFWVATEHPGPVDTQAGYAMHIEHGLDSLRRADTIVLPGKQTPAPLSSGVLAALRAAHRDGARIISLCSGAFILAEAGLLDGRRAATHWRLAAELARRFPAVVVDSDVLYVDHGDVATSAGSGAALDLCLHLVRKDFGAAYADRIARHMVMPPHREGGQLQYAATPPPGVPDSLAPLLDWAAERLAEPLSVATLAARAGVSPRTLARRFAEQLGTGPGQWLLARRIAAAQALLEETDLPVEAVAARTGLSSATNLRRRFHRALRTTPAAYRRTFRRSATV
ncbi:helix-turn-helix domain-containing protein [Streptomyces sp. NBC_00442]|uniref:GlxA family transcriptional regulator n=1 Tax=Streptomyces sp. NBC_00442 TaxID=2903651 RepID=UPI002E1D5A36